MNRGKGGGSPKKLRLPPVQQRGTSSQRLPQESRRKTTSKERTISTGSMSQQRGSMRGRQGSATSRSGPQGRTLSSDTSTRRSSVWGTGSRRPTSCFTADRLTYPTGSRGTTSKSGGNTSNSRLHRVAMEVSVSRLQRWFRVTLLRRLVDSPDALASRIEKRYTWEHRLWKLRTRIAKRIIVEACTAYALSLDLKGKEEGRVAEHNAVMVMTFLRALESLRLKWRKQQEVFKHAVSIIERAWIRCNTRTNPMQTSRERKLIRLLMDEESIERRELVRRRLLFVINCHQLCYNDPLVLETCLSAKTLHISENLFTNNTTDEKSWCGPATLQEEAPTDGTKERQVLSHSLSLWTRSSHCSSILKSMTNLTMAGYMDECGKGKEEKNYAWVNLADTENPSEGPYRRRANACFVTAILLEKGHLTFPESMGAGQSGLDPRPDLASGSAPVQCRARIQDTEKALEKVEVRFVREGPLSLREPLHSLSTFKEFRVLMNSRRKQNSREQTKAFILGPNVTLDNLHYLYPVYRKVKKGKDLKPLSHLSVTSDAMGEEWSKLLYVAWTEECLSRPPSHSFAWLSLARPESSRSYHRRPFHTGICEDSNHPLHDLLVGTGGKQRSLKTNLMSVSFYDDESDKQQQNADPYVDHEKIRYEVERLLIQEYRRRKCIEETHKAGIHTIEGMIARERGTAFSSVKKPSSAPVGRGMSTTFLRLLRESGRV
ncbi:hypothetical protein, conserved [Trypanosoma brucei brucei TREU927]|uniref:Uncharacterized protein n=1 Tax=Trypanosoma brucei brucei (strain 927/4 GUTat10.1) TaxID=185431 RepID=Q38AZ5_TRYB2|nr:hypothetical protein, conserved [Trypanosoma brucei brucei TREU927]EAN78025.1 hypothetical protein, conserved [Trypanosoma brucei brucei TREU927]